MRHTPARQTVDVVAALALTVLALMGAVLTWQYRPDRDGSQRLVQAHEVSIYVAILALALWCALAVADRPQRSRRSAVIVGLGLAAVALVVVTALAWNRVQWVQLGLWEVTAGNGVSGLWYAAFSDDVRFAFVDGRGELSPSDVAPWVVAHLVAPFVALALVAAGWLVDRSPSGPRRSVVTPQAEARA